MGDTYNGWTNYETWAMNLWLDNDEGVLADVLREELYEAMPDLGASVWADLLGASFGEIDWYEIAADLLDTVRADADV